MSKSKKGKGHSKRSNEHNQRSSSRKNKKKLKKSKTDVAAKAQSDVAARRNRFDPPNLPDDDRRKSNDNQRVPAAKSPVDQPIPKKKRSNESCPKDRRKPGAKPAGVPGKEKRSDIEKDDRKRSALPEDSNSSDDQRKPPGKPTTSPGTKKNVQTSRMMTGKRLLDQRIHLQ